MIKLETLKKRLSENGFTFETGFFKTEKGNYAIKIPFTCEMQKFLSFCQKYQIQGIREGKNLYCYYFSVEWDLLNFFSGECIEDYYTEEQKEMFYTASREWDEIEIDPEGATAEQDEKLDQVLNYWIDKITNYK